MTDQPIVALALEQRIPHEQFTETIYPSWPAVQHEKLISASKLTRKLLGTSNLWIACLRSFLCHHLLELKYLFLLRQINLNSENAISFAILSKA